MERVHVQDVSKKFRIGRRNTAALAWVLRALGRTETDNAAYRTALAGVTFNVSDGETVALLGRNGSGKSTLLKTTGGILTPDTGAIRADGTALYINGFGQGLNPKLSMRENISLIGTMMGLSRRQIQRRMDPIVTFSGLAPYLDTKVGTFSTGMSTRLNFSIGIHALEELDPPILLLDEVLGGGGDIDFKKTAREKMTGLIHDRTAVIANHDPARVAELCDRAVWLEQGRVRDIGDAATIAERYAHS